MKAPTLTKLDGKVSTDTFSKKAQEVTQYSNKTSPKTFSIPKRHENYIAMFALQLAQQRQKPVSASEALRVIVDFHSESNQP